MEKKAEVVGAVTMWWLACSWLAAAAFGAACFNRLNRGRQQKMQLAALVALLEACNERTRARSLELERQALEDKLTGLHNRRFMDIDLPREIERTLRFGRELTLAVLDVDDFKAINDSHGHQAGDRVLAQLGEILQQACRGMDGVVRYGGDEFVLYFPETSLAAGRNICQRVVRRVRAHPWASAGCPDLAVTLSAGLASTHGADSLGDLLEAADGRLRAAKRAGKDQINAGDFEGALSGVA